MSQIADTQFINTLQAAFREGDENIESKSEETENVRRVEEFFRSIADGDFEALAEIFADDITMEIVGSDSMPMTCLVRGRKQVIETLRNNFAQVEQQREEIHSVIAQGNTVVVVGRERGRFRPTGKLYDLHWMHQYTIENGRFIGLREMFDSAALLDVIQPENSEI